MDKEKAFLNKVKNTVEKYAMIVPGDKVIVAVSGGADSMALLNALFALKEELRFSLHLCHLNHRFRGLESDEDQNFVVEQSLKLGIPISTQSLNVAEVLSKKGLSLQDGARKVRYEYFQSLADSLKADKIALGHTLDDQAETVLMRMLRGSGGRGLSGIPYQRGKYIRPLIEISRDEIETYLKLINLSFREDSSNKKSIYLRNKVRLELIPNIEKSYNPNLKSTLFRVAEILNSEDEFLNQIAEEKLGEVFRQKQKDEIQIDAKVLSQFHIALQRRIVRSCISKLQSNLENISFEHIESALKLLKSDQPSSKLSLPGQILVSREYDKLLIQLLPLESETEPFEVELIAPGASEIPKIGIKATTQLEEISNPKIQVLQALKFDSGLKSGSQWVERFDAGKIAFPLRIRNRRRGDKFTPLGMSHPKKLKDFFIDEKVPKPKRDRIPLLVDKNRILWVIGHRISDEVKLTENTKKVLVAKVDLLATDFNHTQPDPKSG